MDWEQKLQAFNALTECKLIMRKPGDWYVSQQVDVKQGSCLSGIYGNGKTPQAAVEDHWQRLTSLPKDQYIVAREYWDGDTCKRLAVRWNGFMWDHIQEKPREVAA